MVIIDHISQNQLPKCSIRLEKIYMVEYCEFFKMAFAKILDFGVGSKLAMTLPNDISND